MALPAQVPLVRLPRLSWQPVQVHVGVDEVVEGVIVAAVRSAALCRSRDLALDRRRRGERRWPDLLGGRPSGGGGSEVQDGGERGIAGAAQTRVPRERERARVVVPGSDGRGDLP